ncbi:MAG: STAS domain-containing protein [Planctomycetes bacterium]|nr:STAS domain-containing protein [Planctomycetota bacterium]
MDQDNPKIIVEYLSDLAVVTLTDEKILEEADIQALENSLIPLIEQTPGIKMVLDFTNVQFLSSAVLGMLIRISKKIYESNGQLKLCNINDKIYQVFTITRLDRIFDIFNAQESALADFD